MQTLTRTGRLAMQPQLLMLQSTGSPGGRTWRSLCLCLLLSIAFDSAAQPAPVTPVSMINVPIRLSLGPLTDAAEQRLPQQAGHWRSWKDWHGIKSRYRAWRGPLSIRVAGDTLLVQAHIRYWIRAYKKLLGVRLDASCGINEPPRQALIGMQVRLGWGPDWTLQPRFRILPTRFLDRCEMTIADIDVTPLVEKEFRKQMQHSLRAALRELNPELAAIRQQAQQTWSLLQQPLALGGDHWLLLRPTAVALSGVTGQGQQLQTHLAIALQPDLVSGGRPTGKPTALPPLARYYPRASGLQLRLGTDLDFASLNRQLTRALAGKTFDIKGRKTVISELELGGSGEELTARLTLTGQLAGTASLRTRIGYDAQQKVLLMRDFTFEYAADDFAIDFLAQALHEQVRQSLEARANQALAQQLARLNESLGALLNKITPDGVELDMSDLQLSSVQLQLHPGGIRLDGTASGAVQLQLR
jgi:hypothetical protein